MNVVLLANTPDPEKVVALAAKLCYSKATVNDLKEKIEKKDQENFIKHLADVGHESTFEHASFTFGIEGVSRAFSHQLVRHRIASFSQQSQRYCDFENEDFNYIMPREVSASGDGIKTDFMRGMTYSKKVYDELRKQGISPQDARFALPNAAETKIIVTMNVRSLRHFFNLRCCSRSQWEIRKVAFAMYQICKDIAPNLFSGCGPSCVVNGECPEGNRTCGTQDEMKEIYGE